MKWILSIVIILSAGKINGQVFPSEVWHEGTIVLAEGDTLKGKIKYNLETDLVQFSYDQQVIKTYTAKKLIFFEIFDSLAEVYRRFYVLPYKANGNYEIPVIFELLFEGKEISLLSREAIETKVVSNTYYSWGTYTRLVLAYTYYYFRPDQGLSEFSGKKADLLTIMNNRSAEVKKFIKSNRIRLENKGDLVRVFNFYNRLFDES